MTELQILRRQAATAESFAEAARVTIARIEWNANHPDAHPAHVDDWRNRTNKLGQILNGMLSDDVAPVAEEVNTHVLYGGN